MQLTTERTETEAPSARAVDSVLHAALTIGRLMRQRQPGDQLEPASYWVLKSLREQSRRITELAATIQLDTSTVSRHITQLERSGLIDRSRDPDDRRAHRVGLTEEGRLTLDATLARRRAALQAGFDDWDTADVESLERLLTRLASDIERVHGPHLPAAPDTPASTSSRTHTSTAPTDSENR